MTNMKRARDDKGRYVPTLKAGDLVEVRNMLKEGHDERKIRLALMQARNVSEVTAWRWIKKAKEGGGDGDGGN